jgi:hypothetical protein
MQHSPAQSDFGFLQLTSSRELLTKPESVNGWIELLFHRKFTFRHVSHFGSIKRKDTASGSPSMPA